MTVTGIFPYAQSPGLIRLQQCGIGPNLTRANINISNNELYGVLQPHL